MLPGQILDRDLPVVFHNGLHLPNERGGPHHHGDALPAFVSGVPSFPDKLNNLIHLSFLQALTRVSFFEVFGIFAGLCQVHGKVVCTTCHVQSWALSVFFLFFQ